MIYCPYCQTAEKPVILENLSSKLGAGQWRRDFMNCSSCSKTYFVEVKMEATVTISTINPVMETKYDAKTNRIVKKNLSTETRELSTN